MSHDNETILTRLRSAWTEPTEELNRLQITAVRGVMEADAPISPDEQRIAVAALGQEIPRVGVDGLPVVFRVRAWMCHAGVVNLNDQLFLPDDLAAAAPQLGLTDQGVPNILPMDWNHAALLPVDGPPAVGCWYHAEYAFDEDADFGHGAWGIRADGVMWAWLFPDQARSMWQQQQDQGGVAFSMSCLPSAVTRQYDPITKRIAHVLHSPVFLTLSALDKPPADQDGYGRFTHNRGEHEPNPSMAQEIAAARPEEESTMTELEIQAMQETLAAREEALRLATEKVTELEAAQAGLNTQLESVTTRVAELETLVQAATAELERSKEAHESLTTERDALQAKLSELETAQQEREAAELLAARIKSLPEIMIEAHEAREAESKARVEAKWASMSDEEWSQYLEDELLVGIKTAASRGEYVARSAEEGARLPGFGGKSENMGSQAKKLIKKR